jgi:hypothetical protein
MLFIKGEYRLKYVEPDKLDSDENYAKMGELYMLVVSVSLTEG